MTPSIALPFFIAMTDESKKPDGPAVGHPMPKHDAPPPGKPPAPDRKSIDPRTPEGKEWLERMKP
jgi:hypothetical protein